MKLAFVNQPLEPGALPPNTSVAIWAYEAARRLQSSHAVTIYGKAHGRTSTSEDHEGVNLRLISTYRDESLHRGLRRFVNGELAFYSPVYYPVYILQIARNLRELEADVIQLFNFAQFARPIKILNPRSKIVLRMSCEWLTQAPARRTLKRLRNVDLIIGCSDYITEKIRSRFTEVSDRCLTIRNARDIDYFTPGPRTRESSQVEILFVGRVSPEKGVHVLIDAFADVYKLIPSAKLRIIGARIPLKWNYLSGLSDPRVRSLNRFYSGNDRTYYFRHLKQMVVGYGLNNAVEFEDPIPHAELLKRYRSATVFVFPSVWDEPSGNPPIEAMSCGIPVVATDTGGTGEYVIDQVTGILVPPDNRRALSETLVNLLSDNSLLRQVGAAARRHCAEKFSYNRLIRELEQAYSMVKSRERK